MFRAKKRKITFRLRHFFFHAFHSWADGFADGKGEEEDVVFACLSFFPRTSVSHKKKSGKKCLNAKRNGNRPCVKEKIFAKNVGY